MEKIMKKQNGITLIALIITIIVMLILAGVAISMAVGDNGIIERTQTAIRESERADVQEIIIGSYVFKVTGSFNSLAYIDIPKTGIAIYENLEANGFEVKEPDEVLDENGNNIKDENGDNVLSAPLVKDEVTGEITGIDVTVKGNHGEYNGKIESSGLVGDVTVEKNFMENPDGTEPPKDEPIEPPVNEEEVVYSLVKEEEKNGINTITSVYANQAQAYVDMLTEWAIDLNLSFEAPKIPTKGVTNTEKEELSNIVDCVIEFKQAFAKFQEDNSTENQQNFMNIYTTYSTMIKPYTQKITVNEDIIIDASKSNTTLASLGDFVELNGKVIFGENIEVIGEKVFFNNKNIKGVEFSHSVRKIEKFAFGGCDTIETLTIPNNIEEIGDRAFSGCDGLKKVELNNKILGNYVFYQCTSLEDVKISNNLEECGERVFSSCVALKNVILNCKTTGQGMFSSCTALESITIPESVTNMGGMEFYGCSNLKNVTINNNIISYEEFLGTGIESIIIPGKVKIISKEAFGSCSLLKNIDIQNGVEKIEDNAFSGSQTIENLVIPKSIKVIGTVDNAFGLKINQITYAGTVEDWENITITGSTKLSLGKNGTVIVMRDGSKYGYEGDLANHMVLVQK